MTFEQISGKHGLLHALDARIKLLAIVLYSVVTAVLMSHTALILSLIFSMVLVILSHLPLHVFFVRIGVFNIFIVFLWLFLPWTIPGVEVFHLGPAVISSEGLWYTIGITLRSNALMLALMAFMATTPITSVTHVLAAFRVPDKIIYLFFLTYRYIFEISHEYTRLVNAMRVRSFQPRTNIHTYRSYAYLVGMLLVNSFERAHRIRSAMLCRGFNGRFPRLDGGKISGRDALSLVVVCVVLVGIVYVEV
ncbi:MAG: cobalt ECF transporter T component CbiQ [Desulfomonilia bacterium]